MYDITKTRMLLTTVVFAAVAALFAAAANARIPADTGSAFAAQESLGIGRYAALPSVTKVAQPSETNARIPADTSSAFAAQESLRIGRYLPRANATIRFDGQLAATQSRAGSTRYGYVVGGELIVPEQGRGAVSDPSLVGNTAGNGPERARCRCVDVRLSPGDIFGGAALVRGPRLVVVPVSLPVALPRFAEHGNVWSGAPRRARL